MTHDDLNRPFAPRDVVPPTGMTRESLKRQNDAVNTEVTITTPGEVILDNDGIPNGVGPSTTTTGALGGIVITDTDQRRLGITEHELANDFPNVRVVTIPKRGTK